MKLLQSERKFYLKTPSHSDKGLKTIPSLISGKLFRDKLGRDFNMHN